MIGADDDPSRRTNSLVKSYTCCHSDGGQISVLIHRDFCNRAVQPPMGSVLDGGHDLAPRGNAGTKLVGDDALRHTSLQGIPRPPLRMRAGRTKDMDKRSTRRGQESNQSSLFSIATT
jgi:hypothetical protein